MKAVKKPKVSKYAGIVTSAEQSAGEKLLFLLKAVAEGKLTPDEAVLVIGQGNTLIQSPAPAQPTAQPQQPAQNPQQGQQQVQR